MPIDNTKTQKYYVFVHLTSGYMNETDLLTFYYAFGGSTQPDLNSSLWVNHPRKNQGIDTDYELHFDYSIYDSSSAPALQYYTHTPMGATLINDESWLWVKFTRGSNTFISGTRIGDRELFIQNPEENTQYIGTIMYISEPDPPTPPDPPITTTKYRIYVNRYDNHQRVTNENIWAGNIHVPDDAPYCKKTSGTTGADYAYVEFATWDDLVAAVGGGVTPPTPATHTLTVQNAKYIVEHEGHDPVDEVRIESFRLYCASNPSGMATSMGRFTNVTEDTTASTSWNNTLLTIPNGETTYGKLTVYVTPHGDASNKAAYDSGFDSDAEGPFGWNAGTFMPEESDVSIGKYVYRHLLIGSAITFNTSWPNVLIRIKAKRIEEPTITVTVNGKVTSCDGGTCSSVKISWTGLTVGTNIRFTGGEGTSIFPSYFEVFAVNGTHEAIAAPDVSPNDETSPRYVSFHAVWEEDSDVYGYDQWQQDGAPDLQIDMYPNHQIVNQYQTAEFDVVVSEDVDYLTFDWSNQDYIQLNYITYDGGDQYGHLEPERLDGHILYHEPGQKLVLAPHNDGFTIPFSIEWSAWESSLTLGGLMTITVTAHSDNSDRIAETSITIQKNVS